MPLTSIICLIFGFLLLVGGVGALVVLEKRYIKDASKSDFGRKEILISNLLFVAIGGAVTLLIAALFTGNPSWSEQSSWLVGPYKSKEINYAMELSLALIGGFIFGFASASLWSGFALRFYKTNLKGKPLLGAKVVLYASIPFAICGLLISLEGIAPYLSYPLFNGFSIDGEGARFTKPNGFPGDSNGGFHIAFYALVILLGVAIAYWVSDHRLYEKYHKHGIIDTLVLVAFPAGVIGARIWYVVGNWDREFAGQPFTKVFEIWNGGLTILGGAAAGVLVGYFFLRATKKFVDMRYAIDVIVPTVLLAQAMGRLGNFFNLEVYGKEALVAGSWDWLPSWLLTNMSFKNGGGALPTGYINVPLFLIEALFNVGGYFLIAYGVGKGLKKWTSPGDLCGCYFLWYGVVRIIMEPMRNANFNMGTDNAWSICNSIAYILIGISLIAAFHLSDLLKKNQKTLHFPIIGISLLIPCFFFPFLPSMNVSAAKDGSGTTNVFSGFEVLSGRSGFYLASYILLGLALLSFAVWLVLKILKVKKEWIAGVVGSALSLLVGIFFFVGKGSADLGNIGSSYVNLSYGFVLIALFAIVAAFLTVLPFFSSWIEKRNAKRASLAKGKEEPMEASK